MYGNCFKALHGLVRLQPPLYIWSDTVFVIQVIVAVMKLKYLEWGLHGDLPHLQPGLSDLDRILSRNLFQVSLL